MADRRRPVEARVTALERAVKKNAREIKKLDKRVAALENAYSKELVSVHKELVEAVFEAFGLVPPSKIGTAYEEIVMKKKKAEAGEGAK